MPTASRHPAFDVFLSYDHKDDAIADRLRQALQQRNVSVWIDSQEIRAGERWGRRLEEGLEASSVFALIATHASAKSRWVETEYLGALELAHSSSPDLRLVALLFEDVKLPLILRTFQWVDFRKDFDKAVDVLVEGVAAARGRPADEIVVEFLQPQALERRLPGERPPRGEPSEAPELAYLRQSLEDEVAMGQRLSVVRNVSPAVGLAAVGAAVLMGVVPVDGEAVVVAFAAPIVTGLFGWGATLPRLTEARERAKKFQFLQSALSGCRDNQTTECREYRVEFWRTYQGRATAR